MATFTAPLLLLALLLLATPALSSTSTIVFATIGRCRYAFDIFSLPLSLSLSPAAAAASELRLTDGASVNYNGNFAPTSDSLLFVSERNGTLNLYLTPVPTTAASRREVLEVAPLSPLLPWDPIALKDRPSLTPDGSHLVYVSIISLRLQLLDGDGASSAAPKLGAPPSADELAHSRRPSMPLPMAPPKLARAVLSELAHGRSHLSRRVSPAGGRPPARCFCSAPTNSWSPAIPAPTRLHRILPRAALDELAHGRRRQSRRARPRSDSLHPWPRSSAREDEDAEPRSRAVLRAWYGHLAGVNTGRRAGSHSGVWRAAGRSSGVSVVELHGRLCS